MLEAMCTGNHSVWIWVGFIVFVIFLLLIDLLIFHKKTHAVSIKEALTWTLVWFGVAMLFNVVIWLECGAQTGLQFFTGYLIEKSLSVDNLFVILLVFMSFSIPAKLQHRVLFWGILGALIMRGLLIWAGTALVTHFSWVFYIFGAFLIYSGIKMFSDEEEKVDHEKMAIVRWLRKIVPVSKRMHGEHFFTKENGKFAVTILFVTLIVVEFTDVIFAFDSIPAIFAISTDPFIVFTSNVFAILGLRSLYFVIAKAHDLFRHLKTGLAIILIFIGIKLMLNEIYKISILISLGVVMLILAGSIGISIYETKQLKKSEGAAVSKDSSGATKAVSGVKKSSGKRKRAGKRRKSSSA